MISLNYSVGTYHGRQVRKCQPCGSDYLSLDISVTFTHTALFVSSLFSRQRYVLGDSAMHQMAKSSVFLGGMGGLGVEIGQE